MDNNIFKPPQADLTPEKREECEFYVVSLRKFLWLSILTMGLYYIYWFYKNWQNQMLKTGEKILPVMRGIFSVFFTFSLFQRIAAKLEDKNKTYDWSVVGMAILFIVSTILSSLIGQLSSGNDDNITFVMLISFGFLAATIYSVYKAQMAINIACDDPNGDSNSEFSTANTVWLLIGGLFWLLTLLGMYVDSAGIAVG
ncbi:MAG: hypothetical protein V3U78_04060 [Thiotrichaceae bacterium]